MDVEEKHLQRPNLREIISIWLGLSLKEKIIMILKQLNKNF